MLTASASLGCFSHHAVRSFRDGIAHGLLGCNVLRRSCKPVMTTFWAPTSSWSAWKSSSILPPTWGVSVTTLGCLAASSAAKASYFNFLRRASSTSSSRSALRRVCFCLNVSLGILLVRLRRELLQDTDDIGCVLCLRKVGELLAPLAVLE